MSNILDLVENTQTSEFNSTLPRLVDKILKGLNLDHILKLRLDGDSKFSSLSENRYVERVRHKYWIALLHNPKFVGKLTSSLQNEYWVKVDKLKDYEFSEFNINTLAIGMNSFIKSGIEEETIKMFDRLTIEHTYLLDMVKLK